MSDITRMTIASGVTTATTGSPRQFQGKGNLKAWGTFDTGTIKLQQQMPDDSWIDVDNGAFSAAGGRNIEFENPQTLRFETINMGASDNLNMGID